jgi:hypothetical protein
MDKKAVDKICRKIYHRFPSLKNKKPTISSRPGDKYLLVFEGSGKTPDGKTIRETVRVVATATGQIIKISSSR